MGSVTHRHPSTPAMSTRTPSKANLPTPSSLSRPSKSILKTPSAASRKRKRVDMEVPSDSSSDTAVDSSYGGRRRTTGADADDEDDVPRSSSSPAKKRARVKFEATSPPGRGRKMLSMSSSPSALRVSTTTIPPPREKSLILVREEVRRALQQHLMGDSQAYDSLKQMFTADPKALEDDGSPVYDLPTPSALKTHLAAILGNVSALDGRCSGLVHGVIGSEWTGRDRSYVNLFIKFLGTLAVAKAGYLNSVLKMLVSRLRQVPARTGKLPGYDTVRNSEIYSRIHSAIRHITSLVPAGSVTLSPILSSTFPHDTDTVKNHITYTNNLFTISDYVPELKSDILALITEKLVKIDVQIQVDIEEQDEETVENLLSFDSTQDALGLNDEQEDGEDSDDESIYDDDLELQQLKELRNKYQKVDYTMDLLFGYYSKQFNSGSQEDQEQIIDLLLAHFQTIILPTYRSRHPQFLIFHFAQKSPIFVDRFATICVKIIYNRSQPIVVRQCAAAYLAGFVSRGRNVPSETVRDIFTLLGQHLMKLLQEYEKTCRGPDVRRYGPFYSTAQALLYMFCFRWRDLTTAALEAEEENKSLEFIELDEVRFPPKTQELFHRIVHSKLNPLKICVPIVVREFSHISNHLGLIYLRTIIEQNNRLRLHTFRGLNSIVMDPVFGNIERETRADDDRGPYLDPYFPFDPYKLKQSHHWVEDDFSEWTPIPGLGEREDDDDDTASHEDGGFDDVTETENETETETETETGDDS